MLTKLEEARENRSIAICLGRGDPAGARKREAEKEELKEAMSQEMKSKKETEELLRKGITCDLKIRSILFVKGGPLTWGARRKPRELSQVLLKRTGLKSNICFKKQSGKNVRGGKAFSVWRRSVKK